MYKNLILCYKCIYIFESNIYPEYFKSHTRWILESDSYMI